MIVNTFPTLLYYCNKLYLQGKLIMSGYPLHTVTHYIIPTVMFHGAFLVKANNLNPFKVILLFNQLNGLIFTKQQSNQEH